MTAQDIPKGLRNLAPGCAAEALPGENFPNKFSTLNWVAERVVETNWGIVITLSNDSPPFVQLL